MTDAERAPGVVVHDEVGVALTEAGVDVGEALPLVGHRSHGLRQQHEAIDLDGELALAGGHHRAVHTHPVAQVEALERLGLVDNVVGTGLNVQPQDFDGLGSGYASLRLHRIDEALLRAIAAAHANGRRLFVATANLDAQTTSIWDMGAIAGAGGPAALKLFIDILVASSSLPGLFPPRMIEVACNGEIFEEMHIDGGTISPLFIVPDALVLHRTEDWARRCQVYALVNTTLEPCLRQTPLSAVPILVRSFELMLRDRKSTRLNSSHT